MKVYAISNIGLISSILVYRSIEFTKVMMNNKFTAFPKKWVFTLGVSTVTASLAAFPINTQAAVLLSDNFNTENGGNGQLNYFNLANWNVTDGSVDLIGNGFFDFLPGNGLYLDLDGSTGNAGRIESKTAFTFNPGDVVELKFDLAGNRRNNGTDSVDVSLSLGSLFSETFTLNGSSPFTTITRTINITSPATANLIFDQAGGDNIGLLLDNVQVSTSNAIPEPLTMLGVGTAMGIGTFFKRELSKKQKKK